MLSRCASRVLLFSAVAGLGPWSVSTTWAQSVSANFSYTRGDNGEVKISDRSFAAAPVRGATRTTQFDSLIAKHAKANELNPILVRAVIETESAFNPRAVSRVGAMGLMQLMPGTARDLGVADPFDPSENIRGGTTYLRSLLDRFHGDLDLALAAYNAGPSAVERYDGVPPYRETRDYVAKLTNKVKDVKAITRGSTTIYQVTEITPDGREHVKFTDKKPEGTYSIVQFRAR